VHRANGKAAVGTSGLTLDEALEAQILPMSVVIDLDVELPIDKRLKLPARVVGLPRDVNGKAVAWWRLTRTFSRAVCTRPFRFDKMELIGSETESSRNPRAMIQPAMSASCCGSCCRKRARPLPLAQRRPVRRKASPAPSFARSGATTWIAATRSD
jgi:hypothetical protein